jgi:hypothetical protein
MIDYDVNKSKMIQENEGYRNDEAYEDQEEVDRDSAILYEMMQVLDDELREGSTLSIRQDSFKLYFETLFGCPIEKIDEIEEIITTNGGETYIEIYCAVRDELIKKYDKYFSIKFEDPEEVKLDQLYMIYQVVYVRYISFLCMYAYGMCLGGNTLNKEKGNGRLTANDIVGNYLSNENEFIPENIKDALERSDPGNIYYGYLFGSDSDDIFSNVVLDSEGFRLRIKYEYDKESVKYLIELEFTKYIGNLINKEKIDS